jgi:hypothetical protein
MAEALAHIVLGVVTLLSWLGLGTALLSRGPRVGDERLDFLNRIGVGALAFALATFAAGWGRALYATPFRVVFVLTALIGAVTCAATARRVPRPHLPHLPRASWQLALLATMGFYLLLELLAVCAPISSPDALLYHVADPALFEQAHRIVEVPWNSSSYEPFSVEMLVLDGMLVWDPVQGAFAPLLLGLVALAAVIGFADRLAGRSVALLAGAIFFAQPFMVWELTSAFIEPGLALAVALAAWNLVRYAHHSERRALALAGVFAGGAAGMKYLGLFVDLALVVAMVALLYRRLTARVALLFAAPAVAVALPWYVKNAVLTGNPVYPYVFGGLNSAASREIRSAMDSFGHGHGPFDLVLLPARLLVDGASFDGGQYFSPLFLTFAPLAFLLRTGRRAVIATWAAAVLYMLAWFLTTQQARFLLPLMPILAVLAALGAVALARRGQLALRLVVAVTTAVLVVGLGASTIYAGQFAPVVLGHESRDAFLREKVSNYTGILWLDRHLDSRAKVATDIWGLFYLDMPHVTFGTMGDLLPPTAGADATRAFVDRYGVTHIAILDGDRARRRQVGYLSAQLMARIPVRSVKSRTRGHFGPRHEMLVYALR